MFASLLMSTLAWSQGGLANVPSIAPTQVLRVKLKVVAVDVEKSEFTFYDPESQSQYTSTVHKKTKLRANKKVFKGKPKLEDFKEGDMVQVRVVAGENRLLEVRLIERAAGG